MVATRLKPASKSQNRNRRHSQWAKAHFVSLSARDFNRQGTPAITTLPSLTGACGLRRSPQTYLMHNECN